MKKQKVVSSVVAVLLSSVFATTAAMADPVSYINFKLSYKSTQEERAAISYHFCTANSYFCTTSQSAFVRNNGIVHAPYLSYGLNPIYREIVIDTVNGMRAPSCCRMHFRTGGSNLVVLTDQACYLQS